ncbi:ribonuclease HI [Mariniflexile sp. AS56]|uniref:ribonuclease HI n=1 Tax=Mariniflexile sp. AS56 TaxID=3063957 RepID=UPI0026EB8CD8|nr:ribonuclease HI [Mariniflexile sp. AS56]MDO7170550.1 ribonuclease HI [Mariniflexile sp. AS56]
MQEWEEIPNIDLFSDGGAEPNPGKGGFGVILSYKGRSKEFYQGYQLTTNNRMELMGVIFGLEQLKTKSNVEVYTDSKYVVNGITKGWAEKWKKNNWYRKKNAKAVNSDLWEQLLNIIAKHQVNFNWVKGHDGHIENEKCDQLANKALNSNNLLEDQGYEPSGVIEEQPNETFKSTNLSSKNKILNEGDSCRKCNTTVIKKTPKSKKVKPDQTYYFEYYLFCPTCKTMYFVEEAKREISQQNNLF